MTEGMEPLRADGRRARSVHAVSQPSHVDVNGLLIRPTHQEL
jgi:NADP-dependent 3-hydroxy acid dehydrogenase YdfG